jgi:hypothetical protein
MRMIPFRWQKVLCRIRPSMIAIGRVTYREEISLAVGAQVSD